MNNSYKYKESLYISTCPGSKDDFVSGGLVVDESEERVYVAMGQKEKNGVLLLVMHPYELAALIAVAGAALMGNEKRRALKALPAAE